MSSFSDHGAGDMKRELSIVHPLLQDLMADLHRFTQQIDSLVNLLAIDLSHYEADHIAVRCNSLATAQRWRQGFMAVGQLISEKMINGRPICLFELTQPVSVRKWHIPVVELPYPTEKKYAYEGWEHVELVLRVAPSQLHTAVLSMLNDNILSQVRLKFSQPRGENEMLSNPTVAISYQNVTIKFHPYSIQEIVAGVVSSKA